MAVYFHPHAQTRMKERGASEEEVKATIEYGEHFPAKFERVGFRRNFSFNSHWHGRYYKTKQIEVYAVRETSDWLVITVIVRYFSHINGE